MLQVGPKQQLAGAPSHVGGSLGTGGAAGPLKERKVAEDVVVTIHVKTPLLTNSLHPSHGDSAAQDFISFFNSFFLCTFCCRYLASIIQWSAVALEHWFVTQLLAST